MKKSKIVVDGFINHFLNKMDFLNIPEYVDATDKILLILQRGKGTLRPEIDKIILLGFDAIIILAQLKISCQNMLDDMSENEEYEACALLRDLITTIQNELFDYES